MTKKIKNPDAESVEIRFWKPFDTTDEDVPQDSIDEYFKSIGFIKTDYDKTNNTTYYRNNITEKEFKEYQNLQERFEVLWKKEHDRLVAVNRDAKTYRELIPLLEERKEEFRFNWLKQLNMKEIRLFNIIAGDY